MAWAGMATVLRLIIFARPSPEVLGDVPAFVSWLFNPLPFGFGVYFALVGILHAPPCVEEARKRETQAARLEAQLSEARLSALRMPLQPHFLLARRQMGRSLVSAGIQRLFVPSALADVIIPVADIDWIAADAYHATLHVGPKTYPVRESLYSLEARLGLALAA